MEYTVSIKLSKEYFSEAFEQSLRYANRWRKAERILGVIFVVSGLGLFIWLGGTAASPFAFMIIGLFELLNPYLKKPWWVNRQMKGKLANREIELVLSESGIASNGPYSQTTMAWEGLERVLETPKGVLIWPQRGIHIYLPKSHVEPEVIDYVKARSG